MPSILFAIFTTFNLAVTDREGEAALHLAAGTADGCASLYGAGPEVTAREICRTVSLDGFAPSHALPGPDFIKIDVEGRGILQSTGRPGDAVGFPALGAGGTESRNPGSLRERIETEIQELLAGYGYVPSFPCRRKWYRARDVSEVKSRNLLWFDPQVKAHREKTAACPIIDAR